MTTTANASAARACSKEALGRKLLILAVYIAAIAFAYEFIDRQLATFLKPYSADYKLYFDYAQKLAEYSKILITVLLAGVAVRALGRGQLGANEAKILQVACAVIVAGFLTEQLKGIFGRAWPETWIDNNPSYFGNGTFGFFPGYGFSSQGFKSFPSGHMTAIGAFAGGIYFLWPRLRPFAFVPPIIVAVGLLGRDYHWFSDMIAGTGVGVLTAYFAANWAGYLSASAFKRGSASE